MQQGRVQLDSDWNEFAALLDRRWRAETTDIIGKSTVPKETPDGFRIQITSDGLTIGRGRIYVDGLLAENHGRAPLEFDPILGEERGTLPLPYDEQPYFPNVSVVAPAPTSGGPHLCYLDVWQREVTSVEDLNLIEKAVGVDTTTRLQTVWQVKFLSNIGPDATCGSELEAWSEVIAPSDGRLSSAAVGVPTNTDPCLLPPSGGYRGLENRLYRVEIHDGGPTGTATFKWSRDNASVAMAVTAITAPDKLTVADVGRDSVMHFKSGGWIEITDDWLEFARQSGVSPQPVGVMAQVKSVSGDKREITLMSPIPANVFTTDAQGNTDPARHTQVTRWDQSGQIRDTNGNLLIDLNASNEGVIRVPAGGTSIVLEDGVQITFDTAPGGNYKTGDCWNFVARPADASVEELKKAPPLGVHHHFCRLGLVTFPDSVTDCRTLWPPEVSADRCACTVCVTPDEHNSGKLSLQSAIDRVIQARGGTICLNAGQYELKEPLKIQRARSLRIVGKGAASEIHANLTAVAVDVSSDITLESFSVLCRASKLANAVSLRSARGIRIRSIVVNNNSVDKNIDGAAVGLAGALEDVSIRDNLFNAVVGIRTISGVDGSGTGLADLRIENNRFDCEDAAISLTGVSVHQAVSRISGNSVHGCENAGFVLTGATASGSGIDVLNNELEVFGNGIVVGLNGSRVAGNDLVSLKPLQDKKQHGILLTRGMTDERLDNCQVISDRMIGFYRAIRTEIPAGSVAIAGNQISKAGVGLEISAPIESLQVNNNQMNDIGETAIQVESDNEGRVAACGNQLKIGAFTSGVVIVCPRGDCVFSDNHVWHFGTSKLGLRLTGKTLVVASNRVIGDVPVELQRETKGPCTVLGNIVAGRIILAGAALGAPWVALNHQGIP
jgi:hypothetical protein